MVKLDQLVPLEIQEIQVIPVLLDQQDQQVIRVQQGLQQILVQQVTQDPQDQQVILVQQV